MLKWDHFDILASRKTDFHCKVKETLFIQQLQPALNANVNSEKLLIFFKKAFPLCPFVDSFRLKRLEFLMQMFSV